ncbi:MAG: hypothetical protein IJ491_05220 [Clostridia bacterium]|nr:hypothetical protein [Clostridia bacterium]
MSEWLNEYWHLLVVLVIVTIIAAVIFVMAGRALSRHNKEYKAQEQEIKHLLKLKEKYRNLTDEVILSADVGELLEGTALSYQLILQKKDDIEGSFNEMNDSKRDIYALDVFVQDASVKEFFSENGDILRKRIALAFSRIGMEDFAKRIEKIALMYDKDDETVSYSEKELEGMDEYIQQNDILTEIKLKAAEYIKKNCGEFVN